MIFPEDDHVVETLASDTAEKAATCYWARGTGATWATAHRAAGSCCAGDAEADALVEHGVRANRLVQPPVERIPGYDLF